MSTRTVQEPDLDKDALLSAIPAAAPVGQASSPTVRPRRRRPRRLRPAPVTNLNPDYTFDNFVVGSGTDLAFAAATAVGQQPGHHFNPLFIHGGVGLGKTHLMHAIGNASPRSDPGTKICYVTAEHFMNDLIGSIRDNRTPDFKLKYRSMDVLLVDDVAFLAGKESTQEEFFHTFNALYDLKKQIVLTSRPLAQGDHHPGGAAALAFRVGPDHRHPAAQPGNAHRHPQAQGRDQQHLHHRRRDRLTSPRTSPTTSAVSRGR